LTTRLFKKVIPLQDVRVGDLLWYERTHYTELVLVLKLAWTSQGDPYFPSLVLSATSVLPELPPLCPHLEEFSFDCGPIYAFVDKGDK
jgi:hypothetical protein